MSSTANAYQRLLQLGVAKEQACSVQALLNFIELRSHAHAQQETKEYAIAIKKVLTEKLPILMKMLDDL